MFSFFKSDPKPFNSGYLPTDNGHDVYFREYGNPEGVVVLSFHGGPGGSSKPSHAQRFDLKKCRVILFDQRGGGKSKPAYETQNNTVDDLLNDASRLLKHLKITEKVIVSGGSWGSTLSLLFAQKYPERVEKLIIAQTFLARAKDVEWMTQHVTRLYPDIFEKIAAPIPQTSNLREYYAALMASNDPQQRVLGTSLYGRFEYLMGDLEPVLSAEPPEPDHIGSFGIFMHYDAMNYGVKDNQILDNIETIKHIPTLIVHNRMDLVCPVDQSWEVHKAMPESTLVIVPDYGHGSDFLKATLKEEADNFLFGD